MAMRGMGGGKGSGDGPPKKIDPATIKRVFATFAQYKMLLAGIVVLVLLSAALGILPPYLLRLLIDKGLLKEDFPAIVRYSAGTGVAQLGSTLCGLGYGYLSVLLGQRILRDLRQRLFKHLQGMPLSFFTQTRTGEIQSRLLNDVTNVQSVMSDTVAGILSNGATVISSLVAMSFFDWRLTLMSVGLLPLFAVIASRIGTIAGVVRKEGAVLNASLSATMQETLSVSGVLLVKTSGRQQYTLDRFADDNEKFTQNQVKGQMIMRVFFNLIRLSFSLTPVFVYALAGYLIVEQGDRNLTIGTIVGFTALQAALLFPLTGLLSVQAELYSSLGLFERIFEYLDMKQAITDAPDAVILAPSDTRGAVRFENVTFRYEESQESPTLTDVSFDAQAGSFVALVGASGAGKTTLTYLIPRLYDAEAGRVLIDGNDVKNIKLDSLGKIIGVVTQETYLVHDTIRENLRYGRPDATDEQLIAAAQAAAIHDHIASLPEGYDTVVGERGYKLSGGEKQRIAIARALLKNPPILILDEATSALDTRSERLIQDALSNLSKGRTTFAIAHRLSTILAADQILVMDKGRVVERGTHTELLAKGGAYEKLYAAQFRSAMPTEQNAESASDSIQAGAG
ncbi:MAG: ABC transporter ATP-binding protein [Akkermansiaceae bacterium]|nr:ABC transporter ATP-binding protein [Armatimonadota bacterium]